ncbi:MAG: hypothetical protein JWR27_1205 [Aeromicrobium sp.]|jgi:hypothetical protein|nr:hypothetical protein [Aeromicrobium sp.]
MLETDETPGSGWPPPFEQALVDEGRALVRSHGGIVVVGPPGSGRLALARRIADPWPVRIHRGTMASVATPYYALRRLAPHIEIQDGYTPADLALELDRRRPLDLPAVTVVLIAMDLCDRASLATLIERASAGAIGLIGTISPEALQHHPLLATAPTVRLSTFDGGGIARLLRQRFGCEPDPVAVEFVRSRSEGVYDAVVDVAERAVELGLLARVEDTLTLMPDPGDTSELPPVSLSPGSFHLHDLLDVSTEMTDLLQIVALVEETDVHEVLTVIPAATLDLAVTHGVLRIDGETVRFCSAAESAAVDSSLTLARRLELHDRFSQHFPRTFERPRAAMRAALCRRKVRRPVEPELVVRAARQANLEGLYHEAVTITQPDEHGVISGATERAFALVELGHHAELHTLLESIDPARLTEEELTDFILLRWTYLAAPADDDVLVGDPVTVQRRAAVLRLATLWSTAFQRSGDDLEHEIRTLIFSGTLCPVNTATAYLALSTCQRNGGRSQQAVESARRALDMLQENPLAGAFVLDPAHEILATALLDTLDLAGAEQVLVAYSSRPAPHGRAARMGHALWGLLEYRRGRIGLALTHARLCLASLRGNDPQEVSGWVQAMAAELLAQHGLMDEAASLLERSDLAPRITRLQHDLERRTAEALALDAIGRLDLSVGLLHGVVREARVAGLRKAEIDAAAALVQIGGPDMLPILSRAVETGTDPAGVPAVWARFAQHVEAEDTAALFHLVGDLSELGAVVLAAEIARFTLDFAGTHGRAPSAGERAILEKLAFGTQPVPSS